MVVDANQAPASKYNLVVTREVDLDVRLDAQGNATNTLTLTYQNHAGNEGEPYASLRAWSTNPDGVLATYLRLLTPRNSEIEAVAGGGLVPVTAPEAIDTEANRNVFANYLLLPPGDTTVRYEWVSPAVVTPTALGAGRYTLIVQKQAGMGPEPTTVRIHVPADGTITATSPGFVVENEVATLKTVLMTDLPVTVDFER
jgi:hypothetical protein